MGYFEECKQRLYPLARHEAGHFIIGRAVGLPPESICLNENPIGMFGHVVVPIDHRFTDIEEVRSFCERRAITLLAGAMGEHCTNGIVNDEEVRDALDTTASDDYSKYRENVRLVVYIGLPRNADTQAALSEGDDKIYSRAKYLVEKYHAAIEKLAATLMEQLSDNFEAQITYWDEPEVGIDAGTF